MKYKICASIIGNQYLGEVEADSIDEAEEKGWKLPIDYKEVEDFIVAELHIERTE